MTDEPTTDRTAFGALHPVSRGPLGRQTGGTKGGGFQWLLDEVDRDRGFFSEPDRRLLLTGNWDDELAEPTERNARLRIRNRFLSSFFDARYLRYIEKQDRNTIFENARNAGYDLHFREGFKELVRFTYLGLLELESGIDIEEILETAVREAEQKHATDRGENVEIDVDINVTRTDGPDVEDLLEQYENRDKLTKRELAVLVNRAYTGEQDKADSVDVDLADALYYMARQPESDPTGYSWEDPDRQEAEAIVEWLRSVFEKHRINNYDDLEIAVDRLSTTDPELGEELNRKLSRLTRVAPNFPSQMATDAKISASDMDLLHDILWNPDNTDFETTLEQEVRPRTAGRDWSPSDDANLQKFIARVQVAREMSEQFSYGGEEGRERWNRLVEIAGFEESEWTEYIHNRRVEGAKDVIRDVLDEDPGFGGEHDPPGKEDLDDVRTAEDFRTTFGRAYDSARVTMLEDQLGEQPVREAFEELTEEWQNSEK